MLLKASSDGCWTRLFVLIPVRISLFRLLTGLGKRVKDAFFGEFTTSSLEENCKCLRAKMHEIQDQVDSLQRNTILDMHSTTHRLETGVAKMNLVQTSTLSEIKAVSSTSHSIATGINEINASQDKFHSEYTAKLNGIKAGVDAQNVLDQCPVWVPIPSVWCADLYHVGTVCRGFHIACISACRICAFLRVYNELFAHS